MVLLQETEKVSSSEPAIEGNGAYIEQLSSGNVRVRRGSLSNPGEILWQSCEEGPEVDEYFTSLQVDSQLITRRPSTGTFIWKRDDFEDLRADGIWQLVLECDALTNDFGSLIIQDTGSLHVAWTEPLKEPCDLDGNPPTGRCPTAARLLDMDERIWGGNIKGASSSIQEYSLEQEEDGNLVLWKGPPNDLECQLWDSGTQFNPNDQVYTVMQNDGNLVTYLSPTPGAPFQDIWDAGTNIGEGSYHFVVDVCTFDQDAVAIYHGDPIFEMDAELIGWALFDDCVGGGGANTIRRDRQRRTLRSTSRQQHQHQHQQFSSSKSLVPTKGPTFDRAYY